jgi:hypothetical protein
MTRARLIEAAIVEWFEKDGWLYDPVTGEVSIPAPGVVETVIDLTALAAHLDVEWDRIARGAGQ